MDDDPYGFCDQLEEDVAKVFNRAGLTAQDCHAVATLLVTRRQPAEALAWVERGIDLDTRASHGSIAWHDLAGLKRWFERLAAGEGPSDGPFFLERAKARWGGRQQGDNE
jgi:hypothetical protein